MESENLDTQAWKAGYSSVPAFLRAQKKAKKLAEWEARNAANTTEVEQRDGSRFLPKELQHSYPQPRFALPQQKVEEAPQPSLIPALSPADERIARENYQMVFYPYTDSFDAKKYTQRFGAALGLIHPDEPWDSLDVIRKNLITRILRSDEARQKFQA